MADGEFLLVGWLDEELADVRVCTETPANLLEVLPCVKLTVAGGTDSDNNETFEQFTVVAESFGATRGDAIALGGRVKTAFRRTLPDTLLNNGMSIVTKTQTLALPGVVPYDDTNLRRAIGSFRVYIKTRPIS